METLIVGPVDPEIVALEGHMRAAQLAADVDALNRLISDELLFAGPGGQLATKAQDLDAHATGLVRFHEHEPLELRIRRVGANVAITSLLARLVVEVAGTSVHGTFRYTRVWAQEGDEVCRVVAGQVGEVR